ncbi:EAL domain-containing protein [Bacillus alveayuensis]|jgi:EAL domain-containing protein (putative c-di-GMP-specific phosphodiesterase class I)|uniref:EAL domain-containing protein n=1 Tax=Aeribacillus alveayuensis TaxID=279215 RepID=UPI0005CC95EC|nr:EAL domain-containing protein [Bacillus alveayuensis]
MNSLIHRLIEKKQFKHVYQPIWDLTNWKIIGYESLIRVKNQPFVNVELLFKEARKNNCLYELDTAAIENSILYFPRFYFNMRLLFLNIFPSTLRHEQFHSFLTSLVEKYPFIQGRIVFELNETIFEDQYWEIIELQKAVSMLKRYGFSIAFDDVTNNSCTLQKVNELCPDFIKLDREYANGLAENQENQEYITNLINNLPENTVVILEGIEDGKDLAQAKLIKVPIGQGFLLGTPAEL